MKRFLFALPLIVLLALIACWGGFVLLRKYSQGDWKERAIAAIDHYSKDKAWSALEVEEISKSQGPDKHGWWFSEEMVLMQNGEWITFANACGKSNWRVGDIFIGRGSDDQWYYTSYHFCIGMTVLNLDPQPASLEEFRTTYFLKSFDGKSDDCFQKTWP